MANDDGGNRKGRWQDFGLGGSGNQTNRSPWRFSLIYVAIAVILLFALNNALSRTTHSVELSTFFTQLSRAQ